MRRTERVVVLTHRWCVKHNDQYKHAEKLNVPRGGMEPLLLILFAERIFNTESRSASTSTS